MNPAHNPLTTELQALDSAHFLHPFTDHQGLARKGARIITRADGIYLWDSEGHQILDAMSGLWCVNAGYGRRELAEAGYRQLPSCPTTTASSRPRAEPAVRLAARLSELAPPVGGRRFSHVFFSSSGSESNDTNVRLVRRYWDLMGQPRRKVIISRINAYHGSTLAGASLGGMSGMHAQGDLPLPDITHIQQPYWYGLAEPGESRHDFGLRAARWLEDKILEIGPERVGRLHCRAGAGRRRRDHPARHLLARGAAHRRQVRHPADCRRGDLRLRPPGPLVRLREVRHPARPGDLRQGRDQRLPAARRHADQRAHRAGDGREGRRVHRTAIPTAATRWPARWRWPTSTSSSARTCRAGCAPDTGPYLAQRFGELADHPLVGIAESCGFVAGLALVQDKASRQPFAPELAVGMLCRKHCFDNGLVMRAVGDRMIVAPPLIMDRGQIGEMIALIRLALDRTLADLRERGIAIGD